MQQHDNFYFLKNAQTLLSDRRQFFWMQVEDDERPCRRIFPNLRIGQIAKHLWWGRCEGLFKKSSACLKSVKLFKLLESEKFWLGGWWQGGRHLVWRPLRFSRLWWFRGFWCSSKFRFFNFFIVNIGLRHPYFFKLHENPD